MQVWSIFAGFVLLAAATWAVIDASHLSGSAAVLIAALALGTATGAVVIARASGLVGLVVALAVFCTEGYGMIATAERLIAQRDADQAPARNATRDHGVAVARVSAAEAALNAAPTSTARLTAAVAAKTSAEQAVIAKAADKGCANNCRQLLEAAVASTEREMNEAREELARARAMRIADLEAARAALSAIKIPTMTGTALADRLGIAPWKIDVAAAGLLTVGANLLAAILIAWGAHGLGVGAGVVTGLQEGRNETEPTALGVPDGEPDLFFVRCMVASPKAVVACDRIYDEYRKWCESSQPRMKVLDLDTFATRFSDACERHGIALVERKGEPHLIGMRVAD